MFQVLFVTALLALAVGEEAPKYEECESTMGCVVAFTLSGPKVKDGKYILSMGTNVTAKGTFKTNKEVKAAKVVGTGLYGRIEISFPLSKPRLCEVLKCPLQKNVPYNVEETYKHHFSIFKGNVTLQIAVIDMDSNATIACARFPAKLET